MGAMQLHGKKRFRNIRLRSEHKILYKSYSSSFSFSMNEILRFPFAFVSLAGQHSSSIDSFKYRMELIWISAHWNWTQRAHWFHSFFGKRKIFENAICTYTTHKHTGLFCTAFRSFSNSQSVQLCLTHFRLRISESSSSSAYGCSAVAMRIDEHKFSAPNRTEDMWKLRITVLLTQSVHVFCMCISSASKAQNFLGFVDFIRRIFAKTIPCILLGS